MTGKDPAEGVRALSLAWEKVSGCDSIPTIERVYSRTRSGAYVCIWPRCSFARRDPVAVWRHVHTKHGPDSLPPADFVPAVSVVEEG